MASGTQEALSTFGQGAQQAVEKVQSSVTSGVNNVTGVASDLSSQAQEVLQDTVQNLMSF